jgi:hypothetical protein
MYRGRSVEDEQKFAAAVPSASLQTSAVSSLFGPQLSAGTSCWESPVSALEYAALPVSLLTSLASTLSSVASMRLRVVGISPLSYDNNLFLVLAELPPPATADADAPSASATHAEHSVDVCVDAMYSTSKWHPGSLAVLRAALQQQSNEFTFRTNSVKASLPTLLVKIAHRTALLTQQQSSERLAAISNVNATLQLAQHDVSITQLSLTR